MMKYTLIKLFDKYYCLKRNILKEPHFKIIFNKMSPNYKFLLIKYTLIFIQGIKYSLM